MDYYRLEETLQVLFEEVIPLSSVQNRHIREICTGVYLAGSSQLSKIAIRLKYETQKDSRIQWLRRLLASQYLRQEYVYQPFVKRILTGYHARRIHVVMDRTPLSDVKSNLLSFNLNFRKRAIPLGWDFMKQGSSNYQRQKALIERCIPLLPINSPVIFHGDCEFGSVRLMQYLQSLGWDFVVGQSSKNYYRDAPNGVWQLLSDLPVSKTQAVYLKRIEITKRYGYGPLNLFAFYQPRFSKKARKRDMTYCVTSLPITPALRRTGHRRWGIECCFKDFKSAGWQLHLSDLTDEKRREGLFTVLSLAYLWATCLGRWLCKTSQRHLVDTKAQRHLSLFRLGWDWLVHRWGLNLPFPTLLTLYQ